jgi:glycerate 2-kinase
MSTERLRDHARKIFDAGLQAVDPKKAIFNQLSLKGSILNVGGRVYDLDAFEHIYVVGAGKAGALMVQGIESLLGERISGGIVMVKYDHVLPTEKIELRQAGHPMPDQNGVEGTGQLLELVRRAKADDLIICLLSGGGSALLLKPAEGIALSEKQTVTGLLLRSGAAIHEINTIRKHLSSVKGGQLARIAHPATLISLVLSDVIGDPLDVISSGPTFPDSSTFQDSLKILQKYSITRHLPISVREFLEHGAEGRIPETPKPDDPVFEKTHHLIVANNTLALQAAADKAKTLGYDTMILSGMIEGETQEAAKVHASILKEILHSANPLYPPACVISGGETTVTVNGNGLGGRNQEFVLAGAIQIAGLSNVVIFSAGSDGTDGPTDAAGAIADGNTVFRAAEQTLDPEQYLRNNDSYHFFQGLNDLVKTGPTNTNVMDLRILLVGSDTPLS